jgi:hypothetical protein
MKNVITRRIIMIVNASNPIKGLVLYKCGNTIFGRMKRFQVRENNSQQIIVVPTKVVKKLQKDANL